MHLFFSLFTSLSHLIVDIYPLRNKNILKIHIVWEIKKRNLRWEYYGVIVLPTIERITSNALDTIGLMNLWHLPYLEGNPWCPWVALLEWWPIERYGNRCLIPLKLLLGTYKLRPSRSSLNTMFINTLPHFKILRIQLLCLIFDQFFH